MIKFVCNLKEVKEKFPIIKSRDVNFSWTKNSARSFKEARKQDPAICTGVSKCPGIKDILKSGYILKSWFDFSILTTNDPITFQYSIPEQKLYDFDLVKWFSGDVPQVSIPIPTTSLQTVIKITTPWVVELPEDWSMLIIPIPYSDDPDIEATSGMLTGPGSYEINPIIKIHKKPGLTYIAAGTPLCQLIPIKNEYCEIEIN